MTMRSRGWLAVFVSSLLLAARPIAQKPPALPELLTLANGYVADYAQKLDAVAAEEEFTQYETSSGRMTTPKRVMSAIVLIGQSDGPILDFRDVVAIDNVPVRAKDDRLAAMCTSITPEAVANAQHLTDEAVRAYYSPNLHVLDRPTAALDLLRPGNADNYTFKMDGMKNVNGVQAAVLSFKEKGRGHLMPNAAAVGKFWVGAADGAIQQTELGFIADNINVHATVKFANDPQLHVLVPSELFEQVETSGSGSNMSNMGAASEGGLGAHQALEGRAVYSKYRRLGTPDK